MMRTEIIRYTGFISDLHKSSSFQIALPRDTAHITGVEASLFILNQWDNRTVFSPIPHIDPREDVDPAFLVRATPIAGRLTLMVNGPSHIFYQEEVRQMDNAENFADFTMHTMLFGPWSHARNRKQAAIHIDSGEYVEGYYESRLDYGQPSNARYYLNIYIWTQKI